MLIVERRQVPGAYIGVDGLSHLNRIGKIVVRKLDRRTLPRIAIVLNAIRHVGYVLS